MRWSKIKVGDTISVKTWTRYGRQTITRKVTYAGPHRIGIRFFGWNPFYLHPNYGDKIVQHIPAPKTRKS